LRVPGFHGANDQEACLDWLDIQFGRSPAVWNNNLIFQWDWEKWRADAKETVDLNKYPRHNTNSLDASSIADWEPKATGIRKSIEWALGDEPAMMPPPAGRGAGRGLAAPGRGAPAAGRGNPGQTAPDLVAWVTSQNGNSYGWKAPEKDATASKPVAFGYNVRGDLYYPANTPDGTKLPAVIWLHGFSCSLGYMWVYHNDLHPILALVRAGYAVLAYDQIGSGSRENEAGPFYARYPHWSEMGRMVEDARAAVDALSKDSMVDASRIYAFGYSIGGTVGLYAAALDPRIAGVVSFSGFTPMRTDISTRGDGGVGRYSGERGLMPRLGFFIGRESQIPYDFDEVLAAIAPRPALVVQPSLDRDATPADVRAAVEAAKKVYALYGAAAKLELKEPWDYNRLPEKTQDEAIAWMGTVK
jgi:pimeloyl-ACP methyl ester carboxylesterase